MDKPRIRVKVNPVGNVEISAEGFVGDACTIATKKLEEVLISNDGSTAVNRSMKPEYYDNEGVGEGQAVENSRL